MSNQQYLFAPNQRRLLYLVAGLLWLIGIAVLHYFDGLSILSSLGLTLVLFGSSSSTQKIKWWVNVGIIIVGLFWIDMSYLEHIDPIGNASVRDWWTLGVLAILVGIYWLVQRALAHSIHD